MSVCFSAKPHPSQVAPTEDSGKLIYCTSYIYHLVHTHTSSCWISDPRAREQLQHSAPHQDTASSVHSPES